MPLSIHTIAAAFVLVCLIFLLLSFPAIPYFILFLVVKYGISLHEYYHAVLRLSTNNFKIF